MRPIDLSPDCLPRVSLVASGGVPQLPAWHASPGEGKLLSLEKRPFALDRCVVVSHSRHPSLTSVALYQIWEKKLSIFSG